MVKTRRHSTMNCGAVAGSSKRRKEPAAQQQLVEPWARLISQSSQSPPVPISAPEFSIGQSKNCNLCLKHLRISDLLCKLRRLKQGQCTLEVCGNKGTVILNGRYIIPGMEVPLIGGDEVVFTSCGKQVYIFEHCLNDNVRNTEDPEFETLSSSTVSLSKTPVASAKRSRTDKRTGDTSAVADMNDQVPGHEALERILNDASEDPIELPYALLQNITNDFYQVIGNGGFGVVYLGVVQNKKIAVKKLLQTGLFTEKQFEDELKCLRRVKHKNIVRFLGYCSDTQEKLVEHNGQFVVAEERRRFLCFEYVPNKSLHDYLKDESHGHEWDIHYKLMDGICQGLCYLHIEERITHLDLKPENILLDIDMVPKITDFGLSRLFSIDRSRIITKNIRGSWGYIAPEYWSKGEISFKSDIFSLGVILKKILGGDNDSSNTENGHQSPDTDNPQVKRCIQIAQVCVDDDPCKRPTIDCIINMLSENKTD